jgi:hypothetical protein
MTVRSGVAGVPVVPGLPVGAAMDRRGPRDRRVRPGPQATVGVTADAGAEAVMIC